MTATPPGRVARRIRITGRVQGVFFRASTAEQARALGITGRARNCPDGSVEVFATGTPADLAELVAWLHHGPPLARVDRIEVDEIEYGNVAWPDGFRAG